MKEKINKLFIYKYFRIVIIVIIVIFGIFILIESYAIYIDSYNFKELEKVKSVLYKLDKDSYQFDNIKEFNEKFNKDIKPIKNCYFLVDRNGFFKDRNGGGGYIFGFELESILYKIRYGLEYYVYPKYDLPNIEACGLYKRGCEDVNMALFKDTISNPCQD